MGKGVKINQSFLSGFYTLVQLPLSTNIRLSGHRDACNAASQVKFKTKTKATTTFKYVFDFPYLNANPFVQNKEECEKVQV